MNSRLSLNSINARETVSYVVCAKYLKIILCFVDVQHAGVVQPGYDVPFALSALPGQFLLKDLGLFAACLWVLGASWDEVQARRRMI